jgi:hypothetical protein
MRSSRIIANTKLQSSNVRSSRFIASSKFPSCNVRSSRIITITKLLSMPGQFLENLKEL